MKRIVAIGGGENGRMRSNGERLPWETEPMDREIIRLTGKENPNFLLIAHSQPPENQEGYYNVMKDIYSPLGCECGWLSSNDLMNEEQVNRLLEWADIIYEGGGDTLTMIGLWKDSGFDVKLRKAWEEGKIMCGVSAGANCWFSVCNSDSLKIQSGDDQPMIGVECLGFIDAYFVPHCDEEGRHESRVEQLKELGKVGLMMSNCAALEIVDDQYRVITSDASFHGIEAYALKGWWTEDGYVEKEIPIDGQFRFLSELLEKK